MLDLEPEVHLVSQWENNHPCSVPKNQGMFYMETRRIFLIMMLELMECIQFPVRLVKEYIKMGYACTNMYIYIYWRLYLYTYMFGRVLISKKRCYFILLLLLCLPLWCSSPQWWDLATQWDYEWLKGLKKEVFDDDFYQSTFLHLPVPKWLFFSRVIRY